MEPLQLELPEPDKEQAPAADKDAGVFVIDYSVEFVIYSSSEG